VWSSGWGWLVPLALAAFGACLLARSWRVAGFAAAWALLSFGGSCSSSGSRSSGRADAQVGRLPHRRVPRDRRSRTGTAPRGGGVARRIDAPGRRGFAASTRTSNEAFDSGCRGVDPRDVLRSPRG
jgi:hypothetical protein